MSTVRQERRQWVGTAVLAVLLLVLGGLAVHLSDPPPAPDDLSLPGVVLVPVYLAAMLLSVGFARRRDNQLITLTQVPLAVGVVLVAPMSHLAARLTAVVLLGLYRRHGPLKTLVNLGLVTVEVGTATLVVSTSGATKAGPALWGAVLAGVVLAEVVNHLALMVLFRVRHVRLTRAELVEPAVVAVAAGAFFGGFAVLTIAAALTDPWTLVVVAALVLALTLAYRGYRRLIAQQQATEDLYAFVKDLGPVDVNGPDVVTALERVRELLHTQHLELTSVDPRGTRRLFVAVHLEDAPERSELGAEEPGPVAGGLQGDSMTSPLLVGGSVIGLMTARERIGNDRSLDVRDLRLLETVAAELATALDRGRLLRDLGLAATTDSLTGLPNLRRTEQRIDLLMEQTDRVLLAAVAVDSFREVNDTLGHVVGDDLLREVAKRLAVAAPEGVIGRIGGGRFAVAVPAEAAGDDAAMFGLDLRSRVEGGAQLGAVGTHVRLSVGCVRAPEHGSDAATLLRRAETAMYSARAAHGGPVLWEPAYEVKGQRRLAVVMALREALASGALGIAFQPKVSSVDGSVTGVEALARWTHPALGSITPDEFVPLAEASGLMGQLTSTVLRQALTACKGWQRRGGGVGVAVNVSADTVLDQGFVTEVAAVLVQLDLPPHLLTLELTEGVVVADPELAVERMNELRRLGVRLSVDDFGTGYSSLTYLKGLPIDEVKIDKGFVGGLVADPADQAVVRAVVDIAHTLGMRVVAEGVEQEDQQALLRRLGVDELQGYLHARPMPTLDMAAWLRRKELTRG